MQKFLMMGKYSLDGVDQASAERTGKAIAIIENAGGKVDSIYGLLGDYDLALIVEFPGINEAMKTSIELARLTRISFSTFPALISEDFDKLL